jgi:hypothetical protein
MLSLLVASLLIVGVGSTQALSQALPAPRSPASKAPPVVRVSGQRLVDGTGKVLQLRGVNRSGLEYACIQGWGFFDGPSDDKSIAAMASWATNMVRLPLNEDCWLGINGSPTNPWMGTPYRSAVENYVSRLHAYGMAVILDLQFAEPGTTPANILEPMPDADHAPAFWRSVSRRFAGDKSAVFDLFNEPHNVSWSCWRLGCQVTSSATGALYQAAGMQSLLRAVRSTGATNTIIMGGLRYSNDMTGWLANAPADPARQLAVSFHLYNFAPCNTTACWDGQVAPVAASVPVVTGELGEIDCATWFVNTYMLWADARKISYVAWTWDTWGCSAGPCLISKYDGTPTPFGRGIRDHYLHLAKPWTQFRVSTTSTRDVRPGI